VRQEVAKEESKGIGFFEKNEQRHFLSNVVRENNGGGLYGSVGIKIGQLECLREEK